MSSSVVDVDVRVTHAPADARCEKAARSAASFIRRQVELEYPENKDEMIRMIWELYGKMHKSGMLAAPVSTRRILREKYGFWGIVDVESTWSH